MRNVLVELYLYQIHLQNELSQNYQIKKYYGIRTIRLTYINNDINLILCKII